MRIRKHSYGPALIDDDTPVPAHATFNWSRLIAFALAGLFIWAAVMAGLFVVYGWQGTFTQMGWFFSNSGPCHLWRCLCSLALRLSRWRRALCLVKRIANDRWSGTWRNNSRSTDYGCRIRGFCRRLDKRAFWTGNATPGRCCRRGCGDTVYVLPSFLFILLGGPSVEATRHDVKFTAPLTGITAAVVGVVLNLAVFFAYHVLWPQGFEGPFEWLSALIGLAAFIALFRYKHRGLCLLSPSMHL